MNYETIRQTILEDTTTDIESIHGPSHWDRVQRNGLYLARTNGADQRVVRLFALFHDSMRLDDYSDPEHGWRAKEYILTVEHLLVELDGQAFDQLCYACERHTHQRHHDDVTIGTCWDADRLDLPRVGIEPAAEYLNTAEAIRIAESGDFSALET